jgi:hypothetical protein
MATKINVREYRRAETDYFFIYNEIEVNIRLGLVYGA